MVREVLSDLDTPLSVYLKLADGPHTYLFESVEGGETLGRYSIIGLPARRVYDLPRPHAGGRASTARWSKRARSTIRSPKSNACAPRTRCRKLDGLPAFTGGLVGWFGFECIGYIEPRLRRATRQARRTRHARHPADAVSEEVAVFDNLKGRLYLIVHADPREPQALGARASAGSTSWSYRLRHAGRSYPEVLDPARAGRSRFRLRLHPRRLHRRGARRRKEYIRAGDIFQVVLSPAPERAVPRAAGRRVPRAARAESVAVHVLPRPRRHPGGRLARRRSWCACRTAKSPCARSPARARAARRTRKTSRSKPNCWPIRRNAPST